MKRFLVFVIAAIVLFSLVSCDGLIETFKYLNTAGNGGGEITSSSIPEKTDDPATRPSEPSSKPGSLTRPSTTTKPSVTVTPPASSGTGNGNTDPDPVPDNYPYYVDGVQAENVPEFGNYVVYGYSIESGKRIAWDYDAWEIKNEPEEEYELHFFSVSQYYRSFAGLQAEGASLELGDVVGVLSYYKGSGRGGAVYEIAKSGEVSLGNGKYARLVPFEIGDDKIISVDMFGAHADGSSDDVFAIKAAFAYGGCTVIEFEGENYLQKSTIELSRKDITVNGNGAVISNEYDNGNVYSVDFSVINCENLTLKNLTLFCSETSGKGVLFSSNDHMQLRVRYSDYIVLDGLEVICPDNSGADRHVTSIWLNKGINDITIKNCTIQNFSKSSVGGGIWVSAQSGETAKNINIIDNHIEKSSHDEVLAFFVGGFDGILVEGNYIYTHDEPLGDPSSHAIGFGVADSSSLVKNAVFKDNVVDVVSEKDAFVFSSVDGLEIYDNFITLRNNSLDEKVEYGVFRITDDAVKTTTQKNIKIYDNDIVIYNTLNGTIKSLLYNTGAGFEVYGNLFTVNSYINTIVGGSTGADFYDNTVVLNKGINGSYAQYEDENEIVVK